MKAMQHPFFSETASQLHPPIIPSGPERQKTQNNPTAPHITDHESFSAFKNSLNIDQKILTNISLKRVVAYIDRNYMHHLTLASVSKDVFLHQTYISQLFTKHLGINFVYYLESVRIYKAKDLLQTTDMSIVQIAKMSGYSTPSYFSKAFKRRIGLSPAQYRNASKQK